MYNKYAFFLLSFIHLFSLMRLGAKHSLALALLAILNCIKSIQIFHHMTLINRVTNTAMSIFIRCAVNLLSMKVSDVHVNNNINFNV